MAGDISCHEITRGTNDSRCEVKLTMVYRDGPRYDTCNSGIIPSLDRTTRGRFVGTVWSTGLSAVFVVLIDAGPAERALCCAI